MVIKNSSNALDVYNIYNQFFEAGNFDCTDNLGDGTKEPLFDVSTFTNILTASGGRKDCPPLLALPVHLSVISE
jgi:hypothetical protein